VLSNFVEHLLTNVCRSDSIWALCWSKGNVLTGSLDGCVHLWDDKLLLQAASTPQKVGITSVTAVADGSIAISSSQDGIIRFYSIPTLQEISTIDAGMLEAWTVCLSPNDDVLVSGAHSGTVNIWSMQPGHEKLATLDTNNSLILDASFSPDLKLATAGMDGILNVFDMNTQQIIHKVEAHSMPTRSIKFSVDGNLIYTASDDRHVSVYDTVSGAIVNSFSQTGMAYSVDVSADFRSFVVGCADHSVSVWDLGMQRRVHSFEQHNDQVWGVRYDRSDASGRRFASVGDDALLQLYD
jgi:WD repeat-containing protein 61